MKKEGIKKSTHPIFAKQRTFGQRAADTITKWVGSWTFIILFFVILIVWIFTDGYFILQYFRGEMNDPYPFILLNLFLSCLAAIQAPVILMSQNREAHRDRLLAEYDYEVNKKAEKEIQEIKRLLMKKR